jgi:hypothetical protein
MYRSIQKQGGTKPGFSRLEPQGGGQERNRDGRKYSKSASDDVERVMKKRNKGTLKSGKGGKGGKVTSRKQAIAIGLSEARAEGKKVPKKKSTKKAPTKRKTAKRKTAKRKKKAS